MTPSRALPGLARLCLSWGLALASGAASSQAANFVPNETQASRRTDIVDLEFSQSRAMFTWCDAKGRLFLGTMDRSTGQILDATHLLVDPDAISIQDMKVTTNGPEWISTATGDHIVYTKFVPGSDRTAADARLAWAEEQPDGRWTTHLLSATLARNAPYASSDPGDTAPRISYIDDQGHHYWRNLYDDASEHAITGMPATFVPLSARFVRGSRGIVYAKQVDNVKQVFQLKLDEDKVVQITKDAGSKDQRTVPWMWRAPEYDGKLVLMTTVNGNELRFYRYFDPDKDGIAKWTAFHSVLLPEGSTVASPEPFVYEGKSYVVLAVKSSPNDYPSSIWVAGINPKKPKFWKVTDDSLLRSRSDPEIFISDKGPMVFYNRFDPSQDPSGEEPQCAACAEGLFQADTGLGPL